MTPVGTVVGGITDSPESRPVVASTTRFSGRIIDVRTDEVLLHDNGQEPVERDYVVHPGAVAVIAIDDDDAILLVHQYRHAVGATLWEPPAGILDVDDEDPLVAARRELHEETNAVADDWRTLVDIFTSPGASNEVVRIYLARQITIQGDDGRHERVHEELDMPVAWVPLADAVAATLAGDVGNPLLTSGVLAAEAARTSAGGFDALRPADAEWPARTWAQPRGAPERM
ncbi:MAG TPA: NUDIX hydrolase [Actinomycetota bacterium]|nr:NUDIX hydrolase [Actinomycetota bacterium]